MRRDQPDVLIASPMLYLLPLFCRPAGFSDPEGEFLVIVQFVFSRSDSFAITQLTMSECYNE